jgi:hypothetical protein
MGVGGQQKLDSRADRDANDGGALALANITTRRPLASASIGWHTGGGVVSSPPVQASLARKYFALGVPANFSPTRRDNSSSELSGR